VQSVRVYFGGNNAARQGKKKVQQQQQGGRPHHKSGANRLTGRLPIRRNDLHSIQWLFLPTAAANCISGKFFKPLQPSALFHLLLSFKFLRGMDHFMLPPFDFAHSLNLKHSLCSSCVRSNGDAHFNIT